MQNQRVTLIDDSSRKFIPALSRFLFFIIEATAVNFLLCVSMILLQLKVVEGIVCMYSHCVKNRRVTLIDHESQIIEDAK